MKNTSGMGWDEATQRPTCSSEVWNTYMKANLNAGKFRTKVLRNYVQLSELLQGRQATGEYASTGSQIRKRSNPEDSGGEDTTSNPGSASTRLATPNKRSHKAKDKISGSQLLSGIESLKEITLRSKQGTTIRVQAQTQLERTFPHLSVSEKVALWRLF